MPALVGVDRGAGQPRHIDRSAAPADDLRRIAAVAAADVRRTQEGDKDHPGHDAATVTDPG